MAQQSGPFAAGSIDRAPRRQTQTYEPIQAPRPFWDQVERRATTDRLQVRVAREEAAVQGALNDRHRQIETLLGRPVPRSLMMTGQDARDGTGALPDSEYEAALEQMRRDFPDRLAAIETRAELAARLSGQSTVARYDTPDGPAWAKTLPDGSLWLERQDGQTGPLSRFPGARPVRRDPAEPMQRGDGTTASSRVRSLGERFTSTVEDVAHTNPVMAASRYLLSRGPSFEEFEDPANPGQTIRFASLGSQMVDYERERRDSYRLMAESDAWSDGDASALHKLARGAVTLGGAFTGAAADPTALIAPGSSAVGRIAGSVVVNAATDAVAQAADIGSGIETEYRPLQTAAAAVIGAGVQGAAEGGVALARSLNPSPGGVVGALASEIDAGSRALVRDAPRVPSATPAVRAALARIDRERMDIARFGQADGATTQAVTADLDALRTPLPADPVVERELDDLFGGADQRTEVSSTDEPAAAQSDGPANRPAADDGGAADAGLGTEAAGSPAPETTGPDGHIDQAHADLAALAESGDTAAAESLSRRISNFIDWDDVDLSPADRAAVNAREPVSAAAMIQTARNYREAGVGASMYDPDSYADAMAAQRQAAPSADGGRGNTGPAPAGYEAAEYQGRRILLGSFDPMQIEADPARFQFKTAGDEGLTDRLSGVTSWDRTAAGRAILFQERSGRIIIADGHQRRGLARRLIQSGEDTTARLDGFLMREADGWTPADVRIVAALKNLREDSGALLDAARLLRESPALVNDRSLPITGDFIQNARHLAALSDDAFGAVSSGVIPERYGAVIGQQSFDRPDLHLSMVDLIRQGEPRSVDEARSLVQEAKLADFAESQGLQDDLFGGVPAQSTLIARARLRTAVLKQLRGDARLFASLVRNADAIEAGGNALARSENEARLARDLVAFSAIDKLALRVGSVGDTFGAAASAVTRGELTLAAGARNIVDELRESARMIDAADAERRVTLDPSAPGEPARDALKAFDAPGGKGQAEQIRPKPEDAEAEARASLQWDDLPEVGDEQRAADVLRVCAPGKV